MGTARRPRRDGGVSMAKKYRSLEERLRIYDEVVRLRGLGLGYKRIAKSIEKKYGVSLNPGMICNWAKGRYHPLGRCNKLVEGPGLAYAISAWLGDGRLARDRSNYEYYVKLAVSDYEFAEEWGRCLAEALGRSKPYTPNWDDNDQRWVVKGSSKLLYDLLRRAKENDPRILMPYLEKYPAEACRGFFDAEGWINVERYMVAAGSTNPDIINLFKKLLGKLNIECRTHRCRQKEFMISPRSGKLYRRNNESIAYLAIYGEENILRFAEKVGFTIARKQVELMKLVRKYGVELKTEI